MYNTFSDFSAPRSRASYPFGSGKGPSPSPLWWRGAYPGQPPDLVPGEGGPPLQAHSRNVEMKKRINKEIEDLGAVVDDLLLLVGGEGSSIRVGGRGLVDKTVRFQPLSEGHLNAVDLKTGQAMRGGNVQPRRLRPEVEVHSKRVKTLGTTPIIRCVQL